MMYLHIYLQTQAEKYISHFTVYLNLKYLMRLLYWNQRIYMLNWWRATTWNVLRNMFYTLAANISHYSHSRVTTDVHLEWIFFLHVHYWPNFASIGNFITYCSGSRVGPLLSASANSRLRRHTVWKHSRELRSPWLAAEGPN